MECERKTEVFNFGFFVPLKKLTTQPNQRFKFGEGKISGAVSIFLAILFFLAIFCFKFPELVTSPEFRNIYTGESMKTVLVATIIASFPFAVLSFILNKKKNWTIYTMLINTGAIFLGGF